MGGKLHLKSIKCLRPIAKKCYEGEMQRTLKRNLGPGVDIHVSVCVVACLVCQNQFTCELKILRGSHALSVCVHASWDSQMDCVQTPSY